MNNQKNTQKRDNPLLAVNAGVTSILLAIGCLIGAYLAPSTVEADGVLHEPFFALIPVGFLLLFIGILTLFFCGFIRLIKGKRSD